MTRYVLQVAQVLDPDRVLAPRELGVTLDGSKNVTKICIGDGVRAFSALSNLVTGGAAVDTVSTVAASGSALTLASLSTATLHNVTLTANCTLTFPAAAAAASFTLRLAQDATGGRTVTWPASVKWAGAVAPILSTGATKQDVLTFMCIDGTTWLGFVAGLDIR